MDHMAAVAALIPLAAGHGFIIDPPARRPGDAYASACGQQPFYQQSSDINGNVQGIQQVAGDDLDPSACNLWLCKGLQFGDNKDNVQSFLAGQTVEFDIDIAAPHTGFANVSVVKTATNSVIGEPLIEFDNYASNAGVDANNTAFSVTIPKDVGSQCATAGDCVLQWYWDAPDIDQTYESCVDFVVGGSGGGDDATQASPVTAVPKQTASVPGTSVSSAAGAPEPTTTTPAADDCEEDHEDEEPEDDDCEDGSEGGEDEGDVEECLEDDAQDGSDETDEDSDDLLSYGSRVEPPPSPIIITISTDAPGSTSTGHNVPAPTSPDTNAPAPTSTMGEDNGHDDGSGGNGSNGPRTTRNTVTETVSVTVTAAPTYITETAQPSLCLDLGGFFGNT